MAAGSGAGPNDRGTALTGRTLVLRRETHVLQASGDLICRIWEAATGRERATLTGHGTPALKRGDWDTGNVDARAISPNEESAVSAGDDVARCTPWTTPGSAHASNRGVGDGYPPLRSGSVPVFGPSLDRQRDDGDGAGLAALLSGKKEPPVPAQCCACDTKRGDSTLAPRSAQA